MDNNLQDQIDNIISVLANDSDSLRTAIRVLEQLKEEYEDETNI